jgi:hypothetical protein
MKKRKRMLASPMPTYFRGPRRAGGTGRPAGPGAALGLAKTTVLWVMVSPRLGLIPAAAATAFFSSVACAAGTDLSTSRATSSLLMAPGATLVCVTVLSTPKSVVPVERL